MYVCIKFEIVNDINAENGDVIELAALILETKNKTEVATARSTGLNEQPPLLSRPPASVKKTR